MTYTTALRLGMAEAEQVLRRFTRSGPEAPRLPGGRGTGPGRAASANQDLFHGKDGDLTGADKKSQEASMLAPHLLQSALVYLLTELPREFPQFSGQLAKRVAMVPARDRETWGRPGSALARRTTGRVAPGDQRCVGAVPAA